MQQPAHAHTSTWIMKAAVAVLGLLALLLVVAPAARAATAIDYSVAPQTVVFSQAVTVSGTIDPVAADQEIAIMLDGTDIATVLTGADGSFSYTFTPKRGGVLQARVVADGSLGPELSFGVQPRITLRVTRAQAFVRATIVATVAPTAYTGRIDAVVFHNGKQVGTARATVKNGKATLNLPVPGTGKFSAKLTFNATDRFSQRTLTRGFTARFRTLRVGSRGADVRMMLRQLRRLRFRVPSVSRTLTRNHADAIMAFQKAYGLRRTYVFGRAEWRRLDRARVLKARYSTPRLHIEINKTKQILMVVKYGKPVGIIHVSTGATGNTPVGRHRILWKAYSAPTPYGGLLYWDMEFYPSFAMHAYPSVPPYPASHGCVRQPNWVAPWTYRNSYVGETVYVYR